MGGVKAAEDERLKEEKKNAIVHSKIAETQLIKENTQQVRTRARRFSPSAPFQYR